MKKETTRTREAETRRANAQARYEEARRAYMQADAEAHEAWVAAHETGECYLVEAAEEAQAKADALLSKAISAQHHMQDMGGYAQEEPKAEEVTTNNTQTQADSQKEGGIIMRTIERTTNAIATALNPQPMLKYNLQFFASTTLARANRVVVNENEAGQLQAVFYKTHKQVGILGSEGFEAPTGKGVTVTQKREAFRTWAIEHASEAGVDWNPEYQAQSWNRHHWKYETDAMVEEDAIELMGWTIKTTCEKVKFKVEDIEIKMDSIVPAESSLSYVEDGKYTKNGNWAVATVRLEVACKINGVDIEVIWDIEMRSGQLTKIKMTKADLEQMMADAGAVEVKEA